MPELEIHHESEHAIDPAGQRVGVLAAVLAVALAIVTIASHRTHTAAIIHKAEANDTWERYQATRLKVHTLELGEGLAAAIGAKDTAAGVVADFTAQKKDEEGKGKQIQDEARASDEKAEADERRGLRYDIGEGLLEIGLVLSSLFFISHKKMFPVMGVIAGIAGALFAATGFLM
ncbi:MAG TPA: DUF4337 family protein [Bryobacteraceae bacterium]|nr:DUF4337 family protein [Bryobacteraceae bacterium]HUI81176.1 DUF4337 family protein [Bryobacteraceae bacterium]